MADVPETGSPVETVAVPETPAPAETTAVPEVKPDTVEPKPDEAKFTQKDLDDAISKRLAREQRKYERRLEEENERLRAATQPPPPKQDDARPQRDKFANDEEFVEALIDWKADQKIQKTITEREQQQRQQREAETFESAQKSHEERSSKFREKFADFDDVVSNPDLRISKDMAEVIVRSELGPELAYHLGKNPNEAARIFNLDKTLQAKELGKLEAKLEAKPAPKVTQAPAPGTPIGNGPSAQKRVEDMSMAEYKEFRKKQGASWAQ